MTKGVVEAWSAITEVRRIAPHVGTHSFSLLFIVFDKETIYFYTVARRLEARAEFQFANTRGWLPRASHSITVLEPLSPSPGSTGVLPSGSPPAPRPLITHMPRSVLGSSCCAVCSHQMFPTAGAADRPRHP